LGQTGNYTVAFAAPDNQESISFSEAGNYPVEVVVSLENGTQITHNTNIFILEESNCNGNDNIPPTLNCNPYFYVIQGERLVAYSLAKDPTDNCSSREEIDISFSADDRSDQIRFYEEVGTFQTTIYAHDKKGNVASCEAEFTVVSPNCEDDQVAPIIYTNIGYMAKPGQSISTADITFFSRDFAVDNCTDSYNHFLSFSEQEVVKTIVFEEAGTYPYRLWATDESGNQSFYDGEVIIYDCEDLELNIEVERRGNGLGLLKAVPNLEDRKGYFNYQWDNGQLGEAIGFTESGVYTVTLTSSTGCIKTVSININSDFFYEVKETCSGAATGSIQINPIETTDTYQYTWKNPAGVKDSIVSDSFLILENLAVGLYSFTVTNNDDLSEELEITVAGTLFTPEIIFETSNNCETGNIRSFLEENQNELSFLWSNGASTKDLIDVPFGTYDLTITNAKGCSVMETVELVKEAPLDVYFDIKYDCINREMAFIPAGADASGNLSMIISEPSGFLSASPLREFGLDLDWPSSTGGAFWGIYQVDVLDESGCGVRIDLDITEEIYRQNCETVPIEEDCAIMQIDMAATRLRRCFDNNIYYIDYANYGALNAENAYAEIQLDPLINYVSSTILAQDLGENWYRFDLGEVKAGEKGRFEIEVEVSCEATLGQTHCSKATIYPNQPCQPSNLWSGAEVTVEANCEAEELILRITNTGDGNMDRPLSYITIEDVVMLNRGDFQLNAGESREFKLPKNGSTYRLQAEQVENYPLQSQPSIAIEGCGTNDSGTFSMGYITQFPLDETDRSISIDCQDNIGSFDPNDKLATPIGIGLNRALLQNTDIEYKIRFQNTGTDTAFSVIIVDTLSSLLDTASIQLGASSHPYTYELIDGNVMYFYFDNILLPDSSINFSASEGFVQFNISQLPNLPDRSIIENSAAIYFDYNDPIITNTFWHTIGDELQQIISDTKHFSVESRVVEVIPNPSSTNSIITVGGSLQQDLQLEIYDQLGRLHIVQAMKNNRATVSEELLGSGYYFFRIISPRGMIGQGTFSKQ